MLTTVVDALWTRVRLAAGGERTSYAPGHGSAYCEPARIEDARLTRRVTRSHAAHCHNDQHERQQRQPQQPRLPLPSTTAVRSWSSPSSLPVKTR